MIHSLQINAHLITILRFLFLFVTFLFYFAGSAQQSKPGSASSQPQFREVVAGKQYAKGSFHRFLFGSHYRKEWTTPVMVKVINLDSVAGGLTATEQGGGRQTKTLRLRGANGREYVLRSIAKDYKAVIPEIFQETFAEDIIKDQVSFAHPYAPVTVPLMAEAAGIYHTNPQIVIVPESPRLGEFSSVFANMLCLFEERPDDNQEGVPNFGNSKNVVGTPKMYENIFEDNDRRVDQLAFVRARLFDMFVGDWGRHEDQWRWASFDDGNKRTYKPIPRDRDQTYTKFDGLIPSLVLKSPSLDQLQTFSYKIRDIKKYNLPAEYLDRQLANEPSREEWITIAKDLQQRLTDNVIETSVKQMPPELFSISGEEIIAKLKSRRNHLVDFATEYYAFLTKEVEVVGTKDRELFEVKRMDDDKTSVNLFKITKEGEVKNKPFYSRIFFTNETNEIRLYGLGGKDVFNIEGKAGKGILVRIISGEDEDSVTDKSSVSGGSHKTKVYDTRDNVFNTSSETKLRISNDTVHNNYKYEAFKYDINGIYYKPFLGLNYILRKQKWRRDPFAFQHTIGVQYSLFKNAFYVNYEGLYPNLIGKWNMAINVDFAAPNVENYFGLGNESILLSKPTSYNRVRTTEIYGGIGFNRKFGKVNYIGITGYYQTISLRANTGKLVSEPFPLSEVDPSVFPRKHFAGAQATYILRSVNDEVLPTKGINLQLSSSYTGNLKQTSRSFMRYSSSLSLYLPLGNKFSFATRAGGATNDGETEFYQLNKLGGSTNLRGYRHQRFYGKSLFYNNNEIRFLTDTKNYIFKGKVGLQAFFDNGRVWQPGEDSNEWHVGYGGGILVVPFKKIVISAFYSKSKENQLVDARIGMFF